MRLFEALQNNPVKNGHRDTASLAGCGAFVHAAVASVIAIPPALAGADRHSSAAVGAARQSRQQRRAGDDARRYARRTRSSELVHGFKSLGVDDDGRGKRHPFALVLLAVQPHIVRFGD